ncbi:hypothetical protein ACTA71_006868 [Dictyostelium dimigraforme]
MPNLEMDLYDIPSLENVQYSSVSFTTFNLDGSSFYNIKTFTNIQRIELVIASDNSNSLDFNEFSLIPNLNSITNLSFDGSLIIREEKVNLNNLEKLETLIVNDRNKNLYLNDLILSSSVKSVKFIGNPSSNVTEFIEFNQNVSNITIEDSQLVGSVDSSWCNTIINFKRNRLSGELPTCYTCHLLSKYVQGLIEGNDFKNIDPKPTCTTFIPNLEYNDKTGELILYGNDLGFTSEDIIVSGGGGGGGGGGSGGGGEYNFFPKIPSRLFIATNVFNPDLLLNFTGPNKIIYTLSTVQKSPYVISISELNQKDNSITINGEYFNYNTSSIQIMVGNSECSISFSTFFEIQCQIPKLLNRNTIVEITIKICNRFNEILETTVSANLNQTSNVRYCSPECEFGNYCNTLIGVCEKKCPNDCSNSIAGTCDKSTGFCNCTSNYQGKDCSLPYKPCSRLCNSPLKGECNNQIGICKCTPNYQGSDCTIPSHYITSVIPCSIDGGEVLINGWFGNDNDNDKTLISILSSSSSSSSSFNVIIGNLDCKIKSINQTTIKCDLGAGTGTKNIKIMNSIHSNVVFNGIGLFNYQNPIKTCPNSCTSLQNGKCNINTGECQCNDRFSGFDCSVSKSIIVTAPPTNTIINKDTGDASLINQDTIYEISIISLNEISFDGSTIIKSHSLKGNWSIEKDNRETTSITTTTTTADSNIYKFSQQLINNTCTILYTIEEIKLKDKSFTFGTTTFTVEKDSIKLSVLVKDYQYQSSLNTLQLVFYSAAANTNSNNNDYDNNDCNKKDTTIDTTNANNQQNSNYIQISKNSKTLVGRFINQVIADSRSTFMSSTIINDNDNNINSGGKSSSIKIGLNLPHCNECLIDPDFSVLISLDFKDSCDNRKSSNKNNWLIPVAVVVPIVGCAAIVAVSIIVYGKNRYNIKIFSEKLKTMGK